MVLFGNSRSKQTDSVLFLYMKEIKKVSKLKAKSANAVQPQEASESTRRGLSKFSQAKASFDDAHRNAKDCICLVPVRGRSHEPVSICNVKGEPSEEYYKWQFIYALVNSGLYAKDYIGSEVHFPKGNKSSQALKLDAAIFDSPDWVDHYIAYWSERKSSDLEWLNEHLLAVIEFKKNDKEIERVFTGQVKAAMREKEPTTAYVLGIYYDAERLYLFHRREGRYLRYDESKNQKAEASKVGDLSLHLPDPYIYLPSFSDLLTRVHRPSLLDRSKRAIDDLDTITSIASVQIQTALSEVLRALDKVNLVDQRGYGIFIQTFALKIFDEKRNSKHRQHSLEFYVTDDEADFKSLSEKAIQGFIKRMKQLHSDAAKEYQKILGHHDIDWKETNDVRAVIAICQAFQDYSFVCSSKSDLYQLVFYNFANSFKRNEAAQFLTPLEVIDFIVKLVNPRNGEKVLDPCCGIADFLSLSFINALGKQKGWQLDDANIYGVDLDKNMIALATLNMLLNGDGEAKLFSAPDKGSILTKIAVDSPPKLVDLLPSHHQRGNWDDWPDSTELLKFDVVLTNPPFGEDRAYRIKTNSDREIIEMYQTWQLLKLKTSAEDAFDAEHVRGKGGRSSAKSADAIDLGVVFLENAYRMLKEEGRLGIVLSNSIASIGRWARVREWLMERMRIVAVFDLPANVFIETGVNTSILIAYMPKPKELRRLQEQGYTVFVKDIKLVGYEKRTSKRNVFFNPKYKVDDRTFETLVDPDGYPVRDEEFTETLNEFRQWALAQEKTLQRLFLEET
jgi:type I restriction enzyme M protein